MKSLIFTFFLFFAHAHVVSAHIKSFFTPICEYLHSIDATSTPCGLDGIDCIYVITLDETPSRWQRTKELLEARMLHPTCVHGINGWTLIDGKAEKIAGRYPLRLKASEYGRLLSYVSVLKDAHDRGLSCIWIVEDNLEMFGNVFQLPALIKNLTKHDPNWDLFFTDVAPRYKKEEEVLRLKEIPYDPRPEDNLKEKAYYQKRYRVTDDIMKIHARPRSNSLILSRKGIEKVLNYFTHTYAWSEFDINLHTIPALREYSVRKDIASRWVNYSPSATPSSLLSAEELTSLFYSALKLQSQANEEEALEAFKKRSKLGGDPNEIFWSLFQVGCIYQRQNSDPELFIEAFNQAYLFAPSRAEPLYHLANHYRTTGEANLGFLLANYALSLSEPSAPHVEHWIYHWGVLMEHALCSYYSGRFAEFEASNKAMLSDISLPRHVRKCVEDNLQFSKTIVPTFN